RKHRELVDRHRDGRLTPDVRLRRVEGDLELAVHHHHAQRLLNARERRVLHTEHTRGGRVVGLAVVQLKPTAVELVQVERHVVDRGLGRNNLQAGVLPATPGLRLATVKAELRQLIAGRVTDLLPAGPQAGRGAKACDVGRRRHGRNTDLADVDVT